MILAIISMIICAGVNIFIWLVLNAVQSVGEIPRLFMLFAIWIAWLAGIGFILSAKRLYEKYDDYRFKKQLKKGFEK